MAQRRRLNSQCVQILAMLTSRRVSNRELSQVSLKYTGRISDLRAAGHDVRCVWHNKLTGVATYALFRNGREVTPEKK